ncbi:MAG: aminotransferase class V-fold PLP-dependent enzyme [Steroidobacteraceae bacterium]
MSPPFAVVYLDYAATTPVDPAVVQAMSACLGTDGDFGNAASVAHPFGRRAAARIETARAQVAALIRCTPDEILFTSGATESANLAMLGIARANADRGRHLVTSRIEHKAVLDSCRRLEKEGFSVTYLAPDRLGRVASQSVRAALRSDTVLVSIMVANNEIGVLQDVEAIGAVCREREIMFHTDAAQAVGKVPFNVRDLPIDVASFTAHKLYGPKGVGGLYVRRAARALLQPIHFGGGQERGLRPGTLATHQIVGFGAACELAGRLQAAEAERLATLRDLLWEGIAALGGVHLNGEGATRLPGILNVSFEDVEGESLVTGLVEVAASTGSACNSASNEPSYVLRALGRDSQLAQSSLRFSLGRFTTAADVETAAKAVRREVRRLRAVAPGWEGPVSSAGKAANPAAGELLGPLARQYFLTLPQAGVFPDPSESVQPEGTSPEGTAKVLTGEAGSQGQGTWLRFHLLVVDNIVKDARFQSYGCPHTLAVAAWLAGQLPGRHCEALVPGVPADWARVLEVPIEKLGRLLVVEDALRACLRQGP